MSIKPTGGNAEGVARLRIDSARIYPRIGGTVTITPIEPSPIPEKQAEQLRQLLKELPPELLSRWSAAIDTIANQLAGRGRKPRGGIALAWYKEQLAAGRRPISKLKNEAARHGRCSRRCFDEWLQKDSGN